MAQRRSPVSRQPRNRAAVRAVVAACLAMTVMAACSGSTSDSPPSADTSSSAGSDELTTPAGVSAAPATGSAAAGDLSSEVRRLLDPALGVDERYDRLIKSVIVTVDGRPIYEHYSGDSGPDVAHNVYSVTKSVMSMLIGIAIDEGSIAGVDQTLAELLPSHVPIMAPGVGRITLEQLLDMTGGIVTDEEDDPFRTTAADWVTEFLSTPLAQPAGTGFGYSSRGSHLLSAVIAESTGRSVFEFAKEKLFDPMGISTEPASQPRFNGAQMSIYDNAPGFGWSIDPQGLNLGMSDLRITAADMIKLGQLYLDGGKWHGEELVPATWVADSTQNQVPDGDSSGGYGYQWWVLQAGRHQAFAAIGFAGQLIEVVPDLKLVVAVSCQDDPARFTADTFVSIVGGNVVRLMDG